MPTIKMKNRKEGNIILGKINEDFRNIAVTYFWENATQGRSLREILDDYDIVGYDNREKEEIEK